MVTFLGKAFYYVVFVMMKERYLVLVVGVWKEFNARTNIMGTSFGFMDTTGQYESFFLSFFLYQSYSFLLFFLVSFSFDPTTAYLFTRLLIFSLR